MEITLNDISRRIKEIVDERGYTPYALTEKVLQVVQSTVYNALSISHLRCVTRQVL